MTYFCPICHGAVVIGITHQCPTPKTVFIPQPPVKSGEVGLPWLGRHPELGLRVK
jgi:hypothetical protein